MTTQDTHSIEQLLDQIALAGRSDDNLDAAFTRGLELMEQYLPRGKQILVERGIAELDRYGSLNLTTDFMDALNIGTTTARVSPAKYAQEVRQRLTAPASAGVTYTSLVRGETAVLIPMVTGLMTRYLSN